MLKRFLFLILLSASGAASAEAAVVASDNFSNNGVLVGQTADVGGTWGQSGSTATNPLTVASGAVSFANTGQDVYLPFTSPVTKNDGESLVASFRINVATATMNGDYFFHYTPTVGNTSLFFDRVYIRSGSAANTFNIGLMSTSGGAAAVPTYGATNYSFGTNYSVTSTWNFVAGATNDTFALAVNGISEVTADWLSTSPEPTAIAALNLRQGTAGNNLTLTVSDLSVSSVTAVPEPASMAVLAGAGLVGGVVRYRRKRLAKVTV